MPAPKPLARRERELRAVRSALMASALFALASFLVWGATLAWEAQGGAPSLNLAGFSGAGARPGDELLRLDEEKQELKEKKPADLLPSAVDGWDVEGPQVAPGTSGGIVEAVYLPKDEERNLATPIVAYAQSAHGGGKSASTLLKARDERYPSRASGDIFQGFVTARGFSNDGRSYYMTWAQSGVTYGVEVSFQYVVPSGKSGLLKRSAEEVARAVVHHARTGGGGAGGGMQ